MNQPEDILNIGGLENLPDYTSFKRKTPSLKRYPSNSKRKLTKWYISFVKNNNSKIGYKYWISVNGYLENNSLIQSSPIIDIESPLIILTENTKYYLVDKSDILKFPPHSRFELKELAKFTNGFPQDWKNIIISQLSEIFGVCRIKPLKLTDNFLSPFDKVLKEAFSEDNTVIEENYELPMLKSKIELITKNENFNKQNFKDELTKIKYSTKNIEDSSTKNENYNTKDTLDLKDKSTSDIKDKSNNVIKDKSNNVIKEKSTSDIKEKSNNAIKDKSNNVIKEKSNNVIKEKSNNDFDDIEIKYKNVNNTSYDKSDSADLFLEDNINDFFNDKSIDKETNEIISQKDKLEFPVELLEYKTDIENKNLSRQSKDTEDNNYNKSKESLGIPSELLNISDKLINAENNSFERVMSLINSQKNNKKLHKMKETKFSDQSRFDDRSILEDKSFDILFKKTEESSEKNLKNNETMEKDSLSRKKIDDKFFNKTDITKSFSIEELSTKTSSESLQKTLLSQGPDKLTSSSEDYLFEKSKISSSSCDEIINSSTNGSKKIQIDNDKIKLEDHSNKDRSEVIDFFINSSFNFQDKNNMTNFEKLNEDMTINIKTKNLVEESRGNEKSKINDNFDSIYNMGNVYDKSQENSFFKPNDTDKINLTIINKRKNSQTSKKKNSLGGSVKSTNSFLSCDKTSSQKDDENKSMLETMMNGRITKPYSFENIKLKKKLDTPIKKKNKLNKKEEENQNSINLITANQSLTKEIEIIKKKYFKEEIEKNDETSESSEVEVKSLINNSKIQTPTQSKKKKKKGRTSLCMPKKKSNTKSKTDETI